VSKLIFCMNDLQRVLVLEKTWVVHFHSSVVVSMAREILDGRRIPFTCKIAISVSIPASSVNATVFF